MRIAVVNRKIMQVIKFSNKLKIELRKFRTMCTLSVSK